MFLIRKREPKPRSKRQFKPQQTSKLQQTGKPQPTNKPHQIDTTCTLIEQLAGLQIRSRGHMPPANKDSPHLLGLPAEIRNSIYEHLVTEREPLRAAFRPIFERRARLPKTPLRRFPSQSALRRHIRGRRWCIRLRRFPLEPALAHVNRQLRGEVLGVFYSRNTFLFVRHDAAPLWRYDMLSPQLLELWGPPEPYSLVVRSVAPEGIWTRAGIHFDEEAGGDRVAVRDVFGSGDVARSVEAPQYMMA